jgi:two-component system, cell cycle sensor histidine kinase and response regulator CckA
MKGFTVIETADGKAGVDLFRQNVREIDVVLLDLNLPGMSVREILGELNRIQPNPKVILTSAYSREWAQANLGAEPSWPYLRKPYQFAELAALLRNVCSQKAANPR